MVRVPDYGSLNVGNPDPASITRVNSKGLACQMPETVFASYTRGYLSFVV